MRVALNVEQLLYRSPGGIGRYVAVLLRGLTTQPPVDEILPFTARHPAPEVAAALARAGAGPSSPAPVALRLPAPLLNEAWVRLGWPSLAAGAPSLRTADLVHAPSVAVPPSGPAPLIVTVHDAAPVLFPEAYPPRGRRFHLRGLRAAAHRAELVITPSQVAADEIVTHAGIPAERVRVVHHGVEPPVANQARQRDIRRRFGLDGDPYVLWIGSLEPRKNVRTLVAAMAELKRRQGPAARLVLGGFEGWLSGDLVPTADRDTLGDDLIHVGSVSDEELWALYAGATLFAFPSRHEGFGLPAVEAMSQGTAVVCSDLPVLREVTGGAARYVPATDTKRWADAIGEVLSEPAGRQLLGAAGRARASQLSVAGSIDGHRAVYHEALYGTGSPGPTSAG